MHKTHISDLTTREPKNKRVFEKVWLNYPASWEYDNPSLNCKSRDWVIDYGHQINQNSIKWGVEMNIISSISSQAAQSISNYESGSFITASYNANSNLYSDEFYQWMSDLTIFLFIFDDWLESMPGIISQEEGARLSHRALLEATTREFNLFYNFYTEDNLSSHTQKGTIINKKWWYRPTLDLRKRAANLLRKIRPELNASIYNYFHLGVKKNLSNLIANKVGIGIDDYFRWRIHDITGIFYFKVPISVLQLDVTRPLYHKVAVLGTKICTIANDLDSYEWESARNLPNLISVIQYNQHIGLEKAIRKIVALHDTLVKELDEIYTEEKYNKDARLFLSGAVSAVYGNSFWGKITKRYMLG